MTEHTTTAVSVRIDDDGLATITLDDPKARVNTINDRFLDGLAHTLDTLEEARNNNRLTGAVVVSAKPTFLAGGDLTAISAAGPDDAAALFRRTEYFKNLIRRLETLGLPVASVIAGAALGGGLELALATHRRFAVTGAKATIGLPEVSLGLLPGGGGITRTVRMLGLYRALTEVLLTGERMRPDAALERGLIDEVHPDADTALAAAREWVQNADPKTAAVQPWDAPGFRIPGGSPDSPKLAPIIAAMPAGLRKQLKGQRLRAPQAIVAAAVEGARIDFATACRVESRYFVELALGAEAKKFIGVLFSDMNTVSSGGLRPEGVPQRTFTRIGVLGAGMMGSGIAYALAISGIDVVLKDISVEAAQRGKEYSARVLQRRVDRGRINEDERDRVLNRIHPTADGADLAECEAVIEAVFENADLKAKVYAEAVEYLPDNALICSNTSTLPITDLATHVPRPENFIGLHFFSPVDRMKLVEIIVGHKTTDETLAAALDIVAAMRKVPIVVNDSRGFYTSRVFGTFVLEGTGMVAEGIAPAAIERAARVSGFPVGPLKLIDEVALTLMQDVAHQEQADGVPADRGFRSLPGSAVVETMIEKYGRRGRAAGGGFYDYPGDGPATLWPELAEHFPIADEQPPFQDLIDRYRIIMALETARCFEEGVIDSEAAANIGSVLGLGYPPATGGTARAITSWGDGAPGTGGPAFLKRCRELAQRYGRRFEPPLWLIDRIETGKGLA